MSVTARIAALAGALSIIVAFEDVLSPPLPIVIVGLAAGAGWLVVPGFWWRVLGGGLGGAAAGILILGPGLRLAMRVVAIMEPFRSVEFTVEGTLFLVVGFGAIFGGLLGIVGSLVRVALGTSTLRTALAMAVVLMAMLLVEPDVRSEFIELGAGAWLNIPMFSIVAFGYSIAAVRITQRIVARWEKRPTTEAADVPA